MRTVIHPNQATTFSNNAEDVDVEAIHIGKRKVLLTDGTVVNMDTLIDAHGDDTDDLCQATVAICPLPNGKWIVVEFQNYEHRISH